jgi:predicted amidohydrolase
MALLGLPVAASIASARASTPNSAAEIPAGWSAVAPREEIRPRMDYDPSGGRDGQGAFVIEADDRKGMMGYWHKQVPVEGGKYYRFEAWRKTENVPYPRRSAMGRIVWRTADGKTPLTNEPVVPGYLIGYAPRAESEHVTDGGTDANGWTEVSGVYLAPPQAVSAILEVGLQWVQAGRAVWSDISMTETPAPPARMVRLATVHFLPSAGSLPADKCRLFAPLIAEAASERADLVVLPETLTYYGTHLSYADCAETIPGPSTEYFGGLAQRFNLYIVAGLVERDGAVVYNVAVLLGPDGKVVGKYRKTTLPDSEVQGGLMPGDAYPVFATRFGKVGLMVCYDGFFPEVARELATRGAEVIAWPVWGCNPDLARARACENQVYLVSSTYSPPSQNWMTSSIFGRDGRPLATAETWDAVAVAEVDLNQRSYWSGMGDFSALIRTDRPVTTGEAAAPSVR